MEFFKCLPQIRYMAGIVYDSSWAEKFHKSRNHEFLHVLSGNIRLLFQEGERIREYFAAPGESLIVPAGTLHKDLFDFRKDLKVLYVNFSWDAPEFFRQFNNNSFRDLSPEAVTEIRMIAERMRYDKVHANSPGPQAIENARLFNILLLFWEDLHSHSQSDRMVNTAQKNKRKSPLLLSESVKKYIERNYAFKLHLEEVAANLNISKYHLSRVFHTTTGFSFQEYLSIFRLKKAKSLLLDEKSSISEVAEKCGFENGNYFAKCFKKTYGISPGKFREEEYLKMLKE